MSMHKPSHLIPLILTLSVLAACSTATRQAPVVDLLPSGAESSRAPLSAPTVAAEAVKDADQRGMYTVKKGDTLLRIALDHGQNYRDLVTWNNLPNADDIKVDQVLRVQPPDAKGVSTGVVQTMPVTGAPSDTRAAAAPAPTLALKKASSPRGDKRPYSEAALAELQKPDSQSKPDAKPAEALAAVAPAVPAPAPAPAAAPSTGGDDEKLSWMWPSDGKIVATFDDGKNKGIDIAGKAGQQVMAAGAGKVMYAGSGIRGYGNLVIVKHSNSLLSAYAHNRTIVVKEGQSVNKGQLIAEMGDSDADSVKLHFEIRQQGKPVDPSKFLPSR